MKYTVFENKKTKGRFFSKTEKDETDLYNIVGYCDTVEDAQAMCNVTKELNTELFLETLPPELRNMVKSILN